MIVLRAAKAGACYGVQRALDIAKSTLEARGQTSTLGSLIHNPKVIDELESMGMHSASSIDDIDTDSVIIRSHGVTPSTRRDLHERNLEIIDATCPHVLRAQKAAESLAEDGLDVIVVGEAGHPEVEGLCACALERGARVHIIQNPEELQGDFQISPTDKIGIVVQTTQTKESLGKITQALEESGIDYTLKDTICSATVKRQNAAGVLATQVDAMVVIGGRNSSNTTRLAEICASKCPKTIHIEDVCELDVDFFKGVSRVGVSAGASTPENQIDEVIKYLESL